MTAMFCSLAWRGRLVAVGVHLVGSVLLAALMAALVFSLWYPSPLDEMVGGKQLFALLIVCDVVLGPLITLVVFNRTKPRSELLRDLAVIIAIQLAALGYGIWSVYVARPLYLVFERDLFRVVRWVDIPEQKEQFIPDALRPRPWVGPGRLSLRGFKSSDEQMATTVAEIGGLPMAAMPEMWQAYELAIPEIQRKGQPLDAFLAKFPGQRQAALSIASAKGLRSDGVIVFSLVAGAHDWTVLLSKATAEPIGFLPVNPYAH